MRYVGINRLSAGMKVGKDIRLENNTIPLMRSNSILTDENILYLRKYNIKGIYIEDELSKEIEIEEILPNTLQAKAIECLKKLDIDGTVDNAKEIVDIILGAKNLSFDMISSSNKNIYEHSINVCEFSVTIGRALGYNKNELVDLASAALLHDIGNLFSQNDELKKFKDIKYLCKYVWIKKIIR